MRTRSVPLEDVCDLAQGVSLSRAASSEGTLAEVVQIRNLSSLDLSGECAEERVDVERVARHRLKPGQVVVSLRGVPLKASVVGEGDAGKIAGSNVAVVTPELSKVLPLYLASVLRSEAFNARVVSYITGSAIPTLSVAQLRKLDLPLPSLEAQKAIVAVLQAVDDYEKLTMQLLKARQKQAEACLSQLWGDRDDV